MNTPFCAPSAHPAPSTGQIAEWASGGESKRKIFYQHIGHQVWVAYFKDDPNYTYSGSSAAEAVGKIILDNQEHSPYQIEKIP